MANDLVVQETQSFDSLLQETKSMQSFCRALMETPHYRKMGEEGIFAIVQMAQTLGINPRNALNGELYYTQGRVGMYAEAMSKYIRLKGHSIVTKELTSTKCVLLGVRADNKDSATVTYTIQDAQKAGLIKTNGPWEKHPMQMLWSRAISILKKVLFADLLTTILTKEEMNEMADFREDGEAINVNAEVVQEVAKISSEQVEYLTLLLEQCQKEFSDKVHGWLSSTCGSLDNLPLSSYAELEAKCKRKINEMNKEDKNESM